MDTLKCKICGRIRKISQFQKRKQICERCSDKLKKAKIKSQYWVKRSSFLNKKLKRKESGKNENNKRQRTSK